MNPIKRPLSPARTSGEQFKRFRKNTCLEDLSNELFYEFFDYLDGCEIYKAFAHLNNRFRNLLSDPSLIFRINLSYTSKTTLQRHCRYVIVPNRHRLRSLHLTSNSLINDFFNYCLVDLSFSRLESVVLNYISTDSILVILFYLNSLPRLSSLTILFGEEDEYFDLSDIYRLIFCLPFLKYSKLSIPDSEECEISVPMPINGKPSSIERLVIDFPCTLGELTSLLLHTPHLQHLTCERLVGQDEDQINRNNDRLRLPRLTHISIDSRNIDFRQFEIFIKEISSQLRVFRLTTWWDSMYLDAHRWEQLIQKHMPQLSAFHFDYHEHIDDDDDPFTNHMAIHQFFSSFWIEKNCSFQLEQASDELIFSICPHKETWFSRHTDDQMMPHSIDSTDTNTLEHGTCPNSCIPSIELTLNSLEPTLIFQSFVERMKLYSMAMPFTHLDIYEEIYNDVLIEIIRLIPNLHSLEILSMLGLQSNVLSTENSDMLLFAPVTNKIARVKLHKMDEIEQILLLMDLCPRMEHLEVCCKTENDLKNIVTYLLTNSIRYMHHLRCLCLCVPDANEKMVESLNIIIDSKRPFYVERSVINYKIYRIKNKIFFEWKV